MDRRDAIKRTTLLLGGALSASAVTGVLQGCQPDTSLDWMPQAFSEDQARLLAEIAEIIIPATDTPGAKDAMVDRFIDLMVADVYTEEESNAFLAGLDAFNERAKSAHGSDFLQLDKDTQLAMVEAEDAAAMDAQGERPFFRTMKELTLLGYFTSEPGATQALEYLPIPGRLEGCTPLKEGQKAWAL